jgi:hypothetical protein
MFQVAVPEDWVFAADRSWIRVPSIGPQVLVAVGGLPEDLTVDGFVQLIDAVEAGAPPPEGSLRPGPSSRSRVRTIRSSST